MGNFEENEQKISDYLDDIMTSEEEAAFMQELGHNKKLRKQFEDEILMRSLFEIDDHENEIDREKIEKELLDKRNSMFEKQSVIHGDPMFEPADDHIRIIKSAFSEKNNEKKRISSIYKLGGYSKIAAAVVIIIIGSLVYYFFKHNSLKTNNQNTLVKKLQPPDNSPVKSTKLPIALDTVRVNYNKVANVNRPQKIDTAKIIIIIKPNIAQVSDTIQKKANGLTDLQLVSITPEKTKEILLKFNTPYVSTTDPVQVSLYYNYFKHAQYNKLFAVNENEVMQAGGNDDKPIWEAYIHFYKGLAYMSTNDGKQTNAISEFNSSLKTIKEDHAIYYKTKWYLTMAWLQQGDGKKAYDLAKEIASSKSQFQQKAKELMAELTTQ